MADVSLVYLPYGPLERPSLAFGILGAALARAGIDHEVIYANFKFAETIGLLTYGNMAWVREELVGEWTFAGAAFPDFHPDQEQYLDSVAAIHCSENPDGDPSAIKRNLWKVRELAEEYITGLVPEILGKKPRIIACTSSFNQNCAMLAFTRLAKELDPSIITIVGGANCEGEMGYTMARVFPWLDYVISGEGEDILPALCDDILHNRVPNALPYGVFDVRTRRELMRRAPETIDRASVKDLDRSPAPDFSAYFEGLGGYRDRQSISPGLLIETARGCWWGEKQHCTFCGLNGGGMEFRAKSPDRAIAEYDELAERYGLTRFLVVDNILSPAFFNDVLPALAASRHQFELLFEIKSNINYQQMRVLRDAGGTWIQPGIEALHDALLDLMKKGTKARINVQTLKWARSLGQHVSWNLLCGFPGEQDEWFAEVAGWVPLIEHLQPPKDVRLIRFDRFSPYQTRPAEFGLELRPAWPYSYIYPLAKQDLRGIAYVFESTARPNQRTSAFTLDGREELPSLGGPGRDALQLRVQAWNRSFMGPLPALLCMTEQEDRTFIYDTRAVAPTRALVLDGLSHRVHRQLDVALRLRALTLAVNTDSGEPVDAASIEEAVNDLTARKLVLRFGTHYLALAVAGDVPALPKRNEDGYPGGWVERRRQTPNFGEAISWSNPSPAKSHEMARRYGPTGTD